MKEEVPNIYTIDMLAEESGLNRRTVRYYIHRGLLPPPCGKKRGSYYTDVHLNRLLIINKLADQGVPLVKIAATLEAADPEDDKDAGIDLITTTTRREAELFEGIRVSYLPNLLTRSELKKLSEYIEEMMREKGYASKSERSKAGKI